MATKKKGQEAAKDKGTKQNLEPTKGQAKGADAKSKEAAGWETRKELPSDSGAKMKAGVKEKGAKGAAKGARKEGDRETSKDKKQAEAVGLIGFFELSRQFLKEVAIEFKKISWPARQQVIQETYSVLFLVTVITLMVLAFDWVLGHGVFGPIEHWSRLHGGGVGHSSTVPDGQKR